MSCGNAIVNTWVSSVAGRLKPEKIVWVTGSDDEYRTICNELVRRGIFTPLNSELFPNCFWSRSDRHDVARVESSTFICSTTQEEAGPLNNWRDPTEMYRVLDTAMEGCMVGRTMYVVPYLMGPDGSPFAKIGFELTDSPYVVANMRIMARVGAVALKNLRDDADDFVRGVHSYGVLDPAKRYICHFPQDNTIISFNSNYGGNALQGKKCFALRIASCQARREGWLAEHMLILGITEPGGRKSYICGAFPSACGKTNLAMLVPPKIYSERGWKVETVGDDIAWLNFGSDGRLYAINPEAGFFGVAPGTSYSTNPNAMECLKANTIFTNTALNVDEMTPWWEGLGPAPKRVRDWHNREWTPASGHPAAHPNSRFTAPARQCPSIDPSWESPHGVPISAIVFGGRRAHSAPLVYQAHNWVHGTFVGATIASERTAAAEGKIGELQRDPMAMRPFIGYHAGDYLRHWLELGRRGAEKMPQIFHVNWFRTNQLGKFLWPGFGENIRVLEWILRRIYGETSAVETALGHQPTKADLNLEGLSLETGALDELLTVDPEHWREELKSQEQLFKKIGHKMPAELWDEHRQLRIRLGLS